MQIMNIIATTSHGVIKTGARNKDWQKGCKYIQHIAGGAAKPTTPIIFAWTRVIRQSQLGERRSPNMEKVKYE